MIAAPAFIMSEALQPMCPFFTVGVSEYVIQGLLLLVLCCVIRHFNWRFLLCFGVAVVYGYILDFFLWVLSPVSLDTAALHWVALVIGNMVTAFGVACFFRTLWPLLVYELFVTELSSRFSFSVHKTKSAFDISLLVFSLILVFSVFSDAASFDWSKIAVSSFHNIGLGTLVTAGMNSVLIALWGRVIDRNFRFKRA